MKTRKLRDLTVSSIGFGSMGLSHAYGTALEPQLAEKRIREAFDAGYTLFDTAELYVGQYADGTPSVNEELVGAALKPIRDQVVIASKGGLYWNNDHTQSIPDARPEVLRQSLEGSLKRLNVDSIDLYYQHQQDPNVEPEVVADLMGQFIKEGKIKHWGISNASVDYIERANAVTPVTAVQARYSMMARKTEDMLPLLDKLNIGLVAYSPMANGFLSGNIKNNSQYDQQSDFRSRMPQYSAEGIAKAQKLTNLIKEIADKNSASPAQVSLAWLLNQKPWIVPIPGSSKTGRIVENAGAADITLSETELNQIRTLLLGLNLDVLGN
ncbi:aldehyde oxidase [Lactiplantibacillus fabifermentans T30PCM01]|uniref:Aldehyde oxidase n=1 Tax=Lactiplantibacillus fabifermentans T30PCM01 TaxID=1400520 RepID=W6T442_9LACO|nr:aldo/keto reductase [Lactiplantibacillus fabifermentans]ETY72579.1 aldehyde oxidase [Lactiplantibacillus fabifermentans T30PCM01]